MKTFILVALILSMLLISVAGGYLLKEEDIKVWIFIVLALVILSMGASAGYLMYDMVSEFQLDKYEGVFTESSIIDEEEFMRGKVMGGF